MGTSSVEFKDAYFDGTVTADAFAGPLTGNVTGNASGTAATVTTAAQPNITSLGTLTTLTVDNIIINGTNIGHTSDTDAIAIASNGVVTFSQVPLLPNDTVVTPEPPKQKEEPKKEVVETGKVICELCNVDYTGSTREEHEKRQFHQNALRCKE